MKKIQEEKMSKKLVLMSFWGLISLLTATSLVFGQSWEIVRQEESETHFMDVIFVDDQNGWVVGSDGTILHTTDGGLNWTAQTSGTSNWLYDICYDGGITMWAVGESGIILKYTDPSLPVELSSFTAETTADGVMLKWRTETETNNLGFNVYRSTTKDGEFTKINPALIKGYGTDPTPHDYTFIDETAQMDLTYFYQIEDVDFSGKTNRSKIIEVTVGEIIEVTVDKPSDINLIPEVTALMQNYPNPFNPDTWIPFDLADGATYPSLSMMQSAHSSGSSRLAICHQVLTSAKIKQYTGTAKMTLARRSQAESISTKFPRVIFPMSRKWLS